MKKRIVLLTVLFLMVSPAIPQVRQIIPADYVLIKGPELTEEQAVALKEYMDRRFEDIQRAVDKAEASMNERLVGMNEFRNTLKDQSSKFIPREEFASTVNSLSQKIDGLESIRDISSGKASQTSMLFALAFSFASLLFGVYKVRYAKPNEVCLPQPKQKP